MYALSISLHFNETLKNKKNHRKIHVVHRNFQKNPRTITQKSKKFHQEIQKLPPFHQSQYGLGHPAWHCCKCKYHVPNKYDFTSGEILPPNWQGPGQSASSDLTKSVPVPWAVLEMFRNQFEVTIYVRGRANLSKNCWLVTFWKFWSDSKILPPLSEGCGNRLSIC